MSNDIEKGRACLRELLHIAKIHEMNDTELLLLQEKLNSPAHILSLIQHIRTAVTAALYKGVRPPLQAKMVDVGRNPARMSYRHSNRKNRGKSNR